MKMNIAVGVLAALSTTMVFANRQMDEADTDGDGYVSQYEFEVAHTTRANEKFSRIDANADGMLSEAELTAARDEHRAGRNGRLHRKSRRSPDPQAIVDRLDVDGSGGLSLAEFDNKRFAPDEDAFAASDTDGSGELDAAELQLMMDNHRSQRRSARQGQ